MVFPGSGFGKKWSDDMRFTLPHVLSPSPTGPAASDRRSGKVLGNTMSYLRNNGHAIPERIQLQRRFVCRATL